MQTRAARFRTRARQDNPLPVDDEVKQTFPDKKCREGVPTIGLFRVPNNKCRYKIEPNLH